ncbi:MAG: efflux RND transporter periplasmic adaptor subunit [bacterium]|nr:efflux RND transporter periplasmic adaptor subunit [bacterium]
MSEEPKAVETPEPKDAPSAAEVRKPNLMVRFLVSVLMCLAVIGGGVGIVALIIVTRPDQSEAEAANVTRSQRVPNVRVRELAPTLVEDRITLTGSIAPWEDVLISAETTGKIEWKGVDGGDLVRTGQEMYRIDTRLIRAQFDQAKAQDTLAGQEFDRVSRLAKKGVTAAQDLDSVTAQRDVTAASLRLLSIQLDKSSLKAPFEGIVDRVLREQDEFVDTGTPLVRLVQTHKVKVNVGIAERDVPFFRKGDDVRVRIDALPDRAFTGYIERIATTADMETHTFPAEIALDNPDGALRPGMIARAVMVRDEYPDSLLIPIFASVLLDEDRFAFVVEDGKAQLRLIKTGVVQGSSVQVTAGLSPGDRLIVSGQYDVRDGESVTIQGESS